MIVAQITSPTLAERYFPLESGVHTLGSDLACDVVLLEESVLPRHLTLHVSADTVDVEIADTAAVVILRLFRKRVLRLTAGRRMPLFRGDRLQVGEAVLILDGVAWEKAPCEKAGKAKRPRRRLSLGLLSSAILFAGVLLPVDASAPQYVQWPPSPKHLARLRSAPNRLSSIEDQLKSLGVTPESLQQESVDRWNAIFRVTNAVQKSDLERKITALGISVDARVFADDELKAAASLALSNLPGQAKGLAVTRGVLAIKLMQDNQKLRETLMRQLQTDIPGIKDVRFGDEPEVDVNAIRSSIVAVWSGDLPYIVLTDNKIVRPGEEMPIRGETLVGITADIIRVKINDKVREVRLYD